jgi:hypothetical protein
MSSSWYVVASGRGGEQGLTEQLAMANQPTLKTHDFAYEYLHRQPLQIVDHDRILYDEIMQDPFDGDHWGEGYDSEVKEGWTDSDEGEDGDGDTASEKERIITPLRSKVSPSNMRGGVEDSGSEERLREAEEMMRRLEKGAYWKYGGEVVQPMKVGQGWREVSTGIDVASLAAALDEDAELGQKVSQFFLGGRELMKGDIGDAVPEGIAVRPLRSTGGYARLRYQWELFRESSLQSCRTVR